MNWQSSASNYPPGMTQYDHDLAFNGPDADVCDECDEELELDGVEDEDYFIKDGSRICRKCYMDSIECEEEDDDDL